MPLPIDRRTLVAGMAATAGLGLAGPGLAGNLHAAPDSLSFLVVGDWGRNGASHQRDVAAQMEKAAAETGSRFTVSVGDNFYEDGVISTSDPLWQSSFEQVYTGAHLQTPWYVALGNHDYGGLPQAQIDYSAISPRWHMPARYFKVTGDTLGRADTDLFVIDTSPLMADLANRTEGRAAANVRSQDTDAQMAWLDSELSTSTAKWKLVIGHHTVFSGGSTHGDTPEMIARVLPILQKHRVPVYINGHDHDLQHIERDGLSFVCTGAGSEVRPVKAIDGTKFCTAQSGFSVITVTADALHLEFRNYLGQTVYRSRIA
jgi:tartrate-resistant acid phosphatase type 5